MSGHDSGDDGVVTGVNVTPLVDVMLVLLIVVMVTAHFTSDSELKINLPKTAAAEASSTTPGLTVSLDRQGRLFLMEASIDINGLKAQLVRELRSNSGLRVTLAADGRVLYEQVIGVLDAIKDAGVTRVALASKQESEH